MADVTAFCLTNLPFDLKDEDFKKEVLRIWGNHLNDASFKLFKRDGKQRKGVVCGFARIKLSILQEVSRGKKFKGRNVCLKPDTGEPRDDFGKFLQVATPLARRERDKSHGINYKKLFLAFHSDLVADIGRMTAFKKILTISPVLPESTFKRLGNYNLFFPTEGVPVGSVCVRFYTVLETIQAILYLSGNEELSSPSPVVSNPFNANVSKTKCGTGMGIGGCILDFVSLNRKNGGFIPFSSFKPSLLDRMILGLANLENCISSKCWRCGDTYKLLGIDMDLGYISGTCKCAYVDQISEEDNRKKAYAWDGELFTRLVLGDLDNDSGRYLNLRILHYPMCKQYISPEQYCKTILPILEDEWKVHSTNFRDVHRIEAKLMESIYVETIKVKRRGKEKNVDVYALQIRVRSTKLWCAKERSSLRVLYLNLTIIANEKVRTNPENHKGRVWSVNERNGYLFIHAQAQFEPFTKPNLSQVLEISAKATKTEYEATRKALNKFTKTTPCLGHPYLQLLLNPCSRRGWVLNELKKEDDIPIQDLNGLQYLISTLNAAQRLSFERAIRNSLSIIQGPPGTGKTHNASVLAIELAIKEVGTVVACAPSNEAADNLAEKISTLLKRANIPLSVLRVESKSREAAAWERGYEAAADDRLYDVMRDIVQLNLDLFPIDADLEPALKAWMEGKSHMLKREDREALESRFANIEKMQARMYAIQVYTIATLGDGRAKSFSKTIPITTIIADEIGQATQPSLILLDKLRPKRIVLTGDHLQLQPHVESQSSADAGLNKSALELASSFYVGADNEYRLPPWTVLDTQYRMTPIIRQLVSEVTYEGKLLDADYILSRHSQLPSILKERGLVLLNHKAGEVKRGQSYANPGEAFKVVNYVSELLDQGVKPQLVTILSLYEEQKLEIQRLLLDTLPEINIEVLNVDAFQGRENAVVVVSFTRSNLEKNVGFTKSPNRLNVALSRAKEMLVIAANMETFGSVLTKNWKIFTRIIKEKAVNC